MSHYNLHHALFDITKDDVLINFIRLNYSQHSSNHLLVMALYFSYSHSMYSIDHAGIFKIKFSSDQHGSHA